MPRNLEQELYQLMCVGCEKERHCHIECEHCDEYHEKLEELEEEQYEKEIEEEVERRMETIYALIDAFGFTADDMADYMNEYNDIREQFEHSVREERTNENLIKSLQSVINAERMRTASYKTKYEKSKQSLPIIKEGNKHKCPTCKAVIGKYPYCKYCGQKLEVEND